MVTTLFKASIVALLSTVASLIVTYAALKIFIGELFVVGFFIGAIVPLIIAFPVTYYIERQRKILAAAHQALKESHAQLAVLHKEMERKSQLDLMTGILNRDYFLSLFETRRRKSDQGSLLMIDADHFKRINDTYGHLNGDKALLAIVEAIKGAVREGDILGRIGGEEFAVFLTNTCIHETSNIAERIRQAVEDVEFLPQDAEPYPVTVSIGCASSEEAVGTTDLMRLADDRLYDAKRSGRNKVIFSYSMTNLESSNTAS